MFIGKKKYEEALHKAKMEVAREWEAKMCEQEKRIWEDQEKYRIREDFSRRCDALEKRIYGCEKNLGLIDDTFNCPLGIKAPY